MGRKMNSQKDYVLKPLSDFGEIGAKIINSAEKNGKTIVITENGEKKSVLLNFDEYLKLVELLEFQKAVMAGKEDIKKGKFTQHSDLLKEAETWFSE